MGNAVYILVLFCTIAISICQSQYIPLVTLYTNIGCNGSYIKLPTKHILDLSDYLMDNRAYSVRLTGTWLFYEDISYNRGGRRSMEYIFESKNTCKDFDRLGGSVSSVKFAGNSSDFRADSITFYEYTSFQDREQYVSSDLPNLALYNVALIITGTSAWTVYDEQNYGGKATCVRANTSPNFEPLFIEDLEKHDPRIPHGSVASVRKGCYSANVVSINATSASATLSNLVKLQFLTR